MDNYSNKFRLKEKSAEKRGANLTALLEAIDAKLDTHKIRIAKRGKRDDRYALG